MKNLWSTHGDSILTFLFFVLLIITIVVYISDGNIWSVQILSACIGAIITILATRLLLSKQSEIDKNSRLEDDEIKKNQEKYNAKLKVYSDYVSEMYVALSDNHVTSEELKDLRTKLFASIAFYAEENVLEEIFKKLNDTFPVEKETEITPEIIDLKMARFFSDITKILQDDTKANNVSVHGNDNPKEKDEKSIVQELWGKLQIIIQIIKQQEENDKEDREKERQKEEQYKEEITKDIQIDVNPNIVIQDDEINYDDEGLITNESDDNAKISTNETKQDETDGDKAQYLKVQVWHFNAWGNEQFEQLDNGELDVYELSLVEYGEYWRTNLLKQVGKGDIIMLFRRGGYGYVGAFKAIGRRIFDFEKGEEEIHYFDNPEKSGIVTTKDNNDIFEADTKKYDVYKSRDDGATLCSNLIVKRIAYVSDGVGNPGGVYRRTISRYDSHYAWLLKERFQKKGQWLDN